ncbi:MAG: hypothetical protein WBD36_04595 [Bacteroidota bacterium]
MTPPDATRYFSVTTPHYTIGIAVKDGRILNAAPAAKWAIGKEWAWFQGWLLRRFSPTEVDIVDLFAEM